MPLRTLLEQVGLKPGASWMVAEGADAGRMARSIPLEKALDDVLVAYGQNGEALRPEQGYPVTAHRSRLGGQREHKVAPPRASCRSALHERL